MLGIGSKKRKQDCLLLTEDGRILDIKLSAVKEYVVEHKTAEAWGLFPDACIPERGTGKLFQVITERDCAPMSLNGSKENYSKRMKKELCPRLPRKTHRQPGLASRGSRRKTR